jgi:uncharacterized RDD family membrane protein YckC
MQITSPAEGYPRLVRRLRGVFIDGLVVPIAAMGTLVALSYAGVESTWIRVACPLLVVLLLEPVAVSVTGGSIGHHLTGLRVRKEHVDERINVLSATVRFVVKAVFGLPAFFVAFVTRKRQGLHDLAAKSLIVHKSSASLPAYEVVPARTPEDEHAAYASVWRRLLVILLYWVLLYLGIGTVLVASMSGLCAQSPSLCSPAQQSASVIGLVILLCAFVVTAVLGWRGRLYGCRRRPAAVQ